MTRPGNHAIPTSSDGIVRNHSIKCSCAANYWPALYCELWLSLYYSQSWYSPIINSDCEIFSRNDGIWPASIGSWFTHGEHYGTLGRKVQNVQHARGPLIIQAIKMKDTPCWTSMPDRQLKTRDFHIVRSKEMQWWWSNILTNLTKSAIWECCLIPTIIYIDVAVMHSLNPSFEFLSTLRRCSTWRGLETAQRGSCEHTGMMASFSMQCTSSRDRMCKLIVLAFEMIPLVDIDNHPWSTWIGYGILKDIPQFYGQLSQLCEMSIFYQNDSVVIIYIERESRYIYI